MMLLLFALFLLYYAQFQEKLKQQVALLEEQLERHISESQNAHMQKFELETQNRETLATMQAKMDEMRQILAAREKSLVEVREGREAATAEVGRLRVSTLL